MKSRRIEVGRSSIELKHDPLLAMVARIEETEGAYVKIGIFGNKNQRAGSAANNATIGAVHEFGSLTKKIPRRSFLRVPVIQHLPEAIKVMGADQWEKFILNKGFLAALAQLGVLAVAVIQDAFHSGGFGVWPRLNPATITRKKSSAILIDKGILRRAIHFKVFAPKKGKGP